MKYNIIIETSSFMVIDILTGLIAAIRNKNYESSKMRKGLYNKVGNILCIALGVIIDITTKDLDIGITITVLPAICAYIALMEISSIFENIHKINPNILPENLKKIFKKGD